MSTVIAPISRSAAMSRRVAHWLGVFVATAALALGTALATGATTVFNMVVFLLFAVLWISFAAALVSSPGALDSARNSLRARCVLASPFQIAW